MRAWLYVLAVLMATLKLIVPVACIAEAEQPDQKSQSQQQQQQPSDKLDPIVLAQFEKTLFAQLGMERRPHIVDRTKIVIPDELKDIYHKMMAAHELTDSVQLPMPGSDTKSANTIRSFAHEGNFLFNSLK